ncbi:MAG TPA: hypothetical protein VG929_01615 [Actinomycetota bacterium]|nr:hypothetical protein [Actinomycetota bacterium]
MSLDARLRQGFIATADAFDINAELELINVQAAARLRERRHVFIAAFAGAAAAALMLLAGPRVADIILGIEIQKPFDPAVPDNGNDEDVEEDVVKPEFDPEDVRRANELAERRQQQVETGRRPVAIGGAPAPASGSGSRPAGGGEGTGAQQPAPGPGPTRHHIDQPRDRSASQEYRAGIDTTSQYAGYDCPSDSGPDAGCVEFQARSYERYLSLNISDASGNAVAAVVGIDANRNGKIEDNFEICGSTDGFVEIPAGARIEIQLFADNDSCGPEGAPTRGTVTATFSDRLE